MARAAAYLELARPLNAALAAAAVAVGVLATGARADPVAVLAVAAAAASGVAGANALNDANDLLIDAKAHPRRAIPRGVLSVHDARWFGATALAAALFLAAAANTWCILLATLMAANVLIYEARLKSEGVLGHALVSYNAGALFLLGGLAALAGPADHSVALAQMPMDARLLAPLSMAALAMVLNYARELYKSCEDAAGDAEYRRTLAVSDAKAARRLANLSTWAVIPLATVPYLVGWFTIEYLVALAPLILLLAFIPFLRTPSLARRALKVAMVLGLVPFLVVAFA